MSTKPSNQRSNFVSDKRFEELSTEYLRSKTNILKELGTTEIVKDRERQKQGIDLICDIPRKFPNSLFKLKQKNVDIKSIAKVIPTFCFEISGNESSGQIGWLANPNLLTDYYLLVYHQIENETYSYQINKSLMTTDNVIYNKVLLIKKEKVYNYVKKEIGDVKFEDIVKQVRELSKEKKGIKKYVLDENGKIIEKRKDDKRLIYFTISKQFKERPVNVIIKRCDLEKMAEYIWEIDGNGNPYLS